MKRRILVTDPLAQAGLDLLHEHCQVDVHLRPSIEELCQLIAPYDGLIVRSSTRVSAPVIEAAERLVVIGRAGTGVDNIDLEAATRHGIVVVNAPMSNTVSVAEHTLALMLALARHIPQANASMHAGRWEKKALLGTELRGKTLGIIGLGRVGTAVAQRAHAFEMRLIAYDPFISPEKAQRLGVQLVDLETLLRQADYVSLHAPATERTRKMISKRELGLMKPTAYLINCARGELLDEKALLEALQSAQIAGAALDVLADEPHIQPALRECPNLILTPHLGASTQEAQSSAALEVARQVIDVLEGRPPRYPVNV
ncbi:MAG: phosphoglycerate dehydrogenase, partial [Anaerolineae bacterium]|nr:phosphoglycerate dehydrogenase [Anaerolineae bacterium]